jgi:ribosomal-protein-alanine N-acetyltransferase
LQTLYAQFDTERLRLIPTSIDDADFLLVLLNSPKWLKYIGDRKVETIEDAITYIQNRMNPQLERLGFGNYTVSLKSNNQKIGICGLYDRKGLEGLDIGFAFLPEFEKKGYAFESAYKLLEVAVEKFKIKEISAITTEDNSESQKLLVKLGLQFEKKFFLEGDSEELMLFKLRIN